MLDRIAVRADFGAVDHALFVGVYDGHGSATDNVVDVVRDALHRSLAAEWSPVLAAGTALASLCLLFIQTNKRSGASQQLTRGLCRRARL